MRRTPRRKPSEARKRELKHVDRFLALAGPPSAPDALTVPRDKKVIRKVIRTWRVGEVGVEGTRYVLPGGYITVDGGVYHCSGMEPLVGKVVFFHDDDHEGGALAISHPCWHGNGLVCAEVGDGWIGRARRVSSFEQIAVLALYEVNTERSTEFGRIEGLELITEMFKEALAEAHKAYDRRGEDAA